MSENLVSQRIIHDANKLVDLADFNVTKELLAHSRGARSSYLHLEDQKKKNKKP